MKYRFLVVALGVVVSLTVGGHVIPFANWATDKGTVLGFPGFAESIGVSDESEKVEAHFPFLDSFNIGISHEAVVGNCAFNVSSRWDDRSCGGDGLIGFGQLTVEREWLESNHSPMMKITRWRLPKIFDFDCNVRKVACREICDASIFQKHVGPQLKFSGIRRYQNAVFRSRGGLNGGFIGLAGQKKRVEQSHQTQKADYALPKSQVHQIGGAVRHRLLRYQIGFLTVLGCLAAGVADWFGCPRLFDGKRRQRFWGGLICLSGLFGGQPLWGWALGGYPLAFFDHWQAFWNVALR